MRLPKRAELSEEQEEFLMEAPLDSSVMCVGPPGTGKTVLALYRAALLEKMNKQTDLVMHSKLLNRYVERSLEELNIDVDTKTWHSWVYSHWGKGNGRFNLPQIGPFIPDFRKAIELITQGKPLKPGDLYWEHLIIDEGQDFPKEFYLFLMVMMHNDSIVLGRPTPVVTVFADENQRMEEETNSTISDIKAYLPVAAFYTVTQNYRNTARIAKLASHFYVGMSTGMPDIPEHRLGKVPVMRRFDTLEKEMESVVRWLHNNEDLSAGIIVANTRVQGRVVNAIQALATAKGLRVQKYRSGINVETVDFYSRGTITVVCDKSCKGLEFDGVFIPQLQHYQHDGVNEDFFKMKMYVVISRARSYLQLSFAECDEAPSILKLFPTSDNEVLKWDI
jgi:DNA helicase IV